MKLTYRGISYKFQTEQQAKKLPCPIFDKCGANKTHSFNQLISIKPVYYTYRGVSYVKNFVQDGRAIELPIIFYN